MPHVIVFGASVTNGHWDPQGGWAQRLRTYIDTKALSDPSYFSRFNNLGISGNLTKDIINRFEFETKQRVREGHKPLFLISIGQNDSQQENNTNTSVTPINRYKKQLRELLILAKKYSTDIVFIGFVPVDEPRVDPEPWNPKRSYTNKNTKQFEDAAKLVCQNENVHFIGLYDLFINADYTALLEDGLHPNTEGHQKMFEIVKDYLVKNKLI